ncbi:MAG TPA: isoprenylcysteine carboxylmethyltransferase family protein [Bryobacteraceae bacterium]|jgi:protein-S-isoprenylcysteine O-methyltransferase Ste14
MPDPYRIIGWAWTTVAIVWLAASFTSKRTVRRQAPGSRLLQLLLGAFAALLILGKGPWKVALSRQIVSQSLPAADLGLILTLVGLAFALWARFVLGRNWSGTVTIKRDHELVRSGPYAIVRHPIYSGFLLALLGTAIARGNLGAFAGFAVAALTLRLKATSEESFMVEQFGPQYALYKRNVKALVPFVW